MAHKVKVLSFLAEKQKVKKQERRMKLKSVL